MDSLNLYEEENRQIEERYHLVMERLSEILSEETVSEQVREYFTANARLFLLLKTVADKACMQTFDQLEAIEKKEINTRLYKDICGINYETSYTNPTFATDKLGKYAKDLCFLATEIRGLIPAAFEGRLLFLTIYAELFVEIYNYFEEEDDYTVKDVHKAIYYFCSDYLDVTMEARIRELFDPSCDFAKDIIMKSDLTDLSYLYLYGEYISENEIRIAKFMNSLSEEKIVSMARTFTDGFKRGYVNARLDLSKKKTVAIRFRIGFERMIREVIRQFEEIGIAAILYRAATLSVNKRLSLKIGYHSTSPNKQYDYDHRFDEGIYLDKPFVQRKLVCTRQAYEDMKELVSKFAGPSVIQIFGESKFEPIAKKECISLDEKQQKISIEYSRESADLSNEFLKQDEISFAMIAYPIPEIGEKFHEIFEETVMVNTLDNQVYQTIQQTIIDALDICDYAYIVGKGENQTDLVVNLWKLQNSEKETIFENCTADVNIPVGEVFTSPVLEGTTGILHVSRVFLGELEYLDLKLEFKDGMIVDYSCKNFDSEEENKAYIKENLLYNNDTLPMGEFAIGTNTTAYTMARKYDISDKLPILIAEKTGPHFAVGDTCYKRSEEHAVYNPDGKEIVARENEVSRLRDSKPEEAYYNCHTDITIPYDELDSITGIRLDGTKIEIIKDSRFVLPGTEELNKALQ